MLHRIVPIVFVALCAAVPIAVADEQPLPGTLPGALPGAGVAVTVYKDFGVVQDTRTMNLPDRVCSVSFRDVAAWIDPTSVHFASLTDPTGTAVLEQNYEYDLVCNDSLLSRYIDQRLVVHTVGGERFEGKLLSYDSDQLIVQGDKQLYLIQRNQNVRDIEFSTLPEGLLTRPTLVWKIAAEKPGNQLVRVTYHTKNIGWHADYTARLNDDETQIDLAGWVTVDNHSGAAYKNAQLKLVAGDVNLIDKEKDNSGNSLFISSPTMSRPGFNADSLFEYHLYTLKDRTTIANGQIKQIELLRAAAVPITKRYVFEPDGQFGHARANTPDEFKVNVYVEFTNNEASHLGMPLPGGKVRVYKRPGATAKDAAGDGEFVGEDVIDHTPRDEKAKMYVGDAFDLVGQVIISDSEEGEKWSREKVKIELRNHKDTPVTIYVREHDRGRGTWAVSNASMPFKNIGSAIKEFEVNVAPHGTSQITFTSDYHW